MNGLKKVTALSCALGIAGCALVGYSLSRGSGVAELTAQSLIEKKRGNLVTAQKKLKEALAIQEAASKEDAATVAILDELGSIAASQGRSAESLRYFERSRLMNGRLMKPHLLVAATSLTGLGEALTESGQYEKAENVLQEALTIRENNLEANSVDVAETRDALARLYSAAGYYVQAEALFKQALASLDQYPERKAEVLNNFGACLFNQGGLSYAREKFISALSLLKGEGFKNSLVKANILTNLAEVERRMDSPKSAEGRLSEALAIYEKRLDADSPVLANAYNNLALVLRYQGRMQEAEPLYKKSIAIYDKVGGDGDGQKNSSLKNVMRNYAELLSATGRTDEAENLRRKAAKSTG
ncbi:MAG: tetratricopeptide repeat protein [Candidatus Melainabacteria bacterium]|nr:tetratricopeptide repeat protein [Candidatus Melainabacteria bacterium]OPZ90830.1 MAG: photosystem I assembly protein Ycf3 [bacterium ADurb.Bin425]